MRLHEFVAVCCSLVRCGALHLSSIGYALTRLGSVYDARALIYQYVHVHVYIYIYLSIHIYIYIYEYIYICIHLYIYIDI